MVRMNELDVENKPLRDELQARRDILHQKEQEAKDAKAAKDANSAPILDLDAHSYPAITSFFARDGNWVEGVPGADGYPVDTMKWPAGAHDMKFKGWKYYSLPEGVSYVRLNFYYKLKQELHAVGENWGVKIFGHVLGHSAMQECGVDHWCWMSLVVPSSMDDDGHILLLADDIDGAFEAEFKQITLEGFGKEVEPLAEPVVAN
jgi:hypothetical protein